ncbi:MAG: carboxypeptidase C (cathepsin A)/predicted enzyme related to lactoylglutathione lyase [Planctomycetota bacterium]|jgi:carboxypeptidase C (cathepsin A)/predicted enzyme related to lactoylglutathione lyase
MSSFHIYAISLLFAASALAPHNWAQDVPEAEDSSSDLPEMHNSGVSSTVEVDGRSLAYKATCADYAIRDDDGETTGYFSAFSYVVESESSARPVTFAFNGGPGSSSVWLHMGLLGPMRVVVPSDARNAGAPPYPLVDNPHTLLTHSDLVFVDPIGTGLSRAVGDAEDSDFWGVDQDVDSVARFIREWLKVNKRWSSPKYVLGESYGGVRGALLAESLKGNSTSVALNGIVFISPAFDIQFVDGREDDLTYVTSFPTYAATALYHNTQEGVVANREAWLQEARLFASGPYMRALFAGQTLPPNERANVLKSLSRFTGLSQDYWDRANLRVNASRFRKEILRSEDTVLGRLDTRYRGNDTDAVGETPDSDPMFSAIGSAYVAGFQHYTGDVLNITPEDRDYKFSGNGVFGRWKRSAAGQTAFAGWLDTVPALAGAMRDNPDLQVFCANGWFDVATTVLAAEYNLSRPGIDGDRVVIENYDAGHMMYVHQPSLEALAKDLRHFYENHHTNTPRLPKPPIAMTKPRVDSSINYIELPCTDMAATKTFFNKAFGWQWNDWGAEYADCNNAGVNCGLRHVEKTLGNGALVILYANDLEATQTRIVESGGTISAEIVPFPGGRRFQFIEPSGNELAVWTTE